MAANRGSGLKFLQWFIRGVQFGSAALILSIYSYFLATLSNHKLPISTTIRAVEGIAGVAVLYTLSGLLMLCWIAGRTFTSFLAILFDVAFIAAFIYVAVANKAGASSCTGHLDTPFGDGEAAESPEGGDGFTALPSYHVACKLQSACLAVSIIAILFFCFSILAEVALGRNHHRQKRYSVSPSNGYAPAAPTPDAAAAPTPKPSFFKRIFRRKTVVHDSDSTLPHHTLPDQLKETRHSYNTERTAVEPNPEPYHKDEQDFGYRGANQRGDGYGPIHYPEPEHQPQTTGYPSGNYHYDDGIYDRR